MWAREEPVLDPPVRRQDTEPFEGASVEDTGRDRAFENTAPEVRLVSGNDLERGGVVLAPEACDAASPVHEILAVAGGALSRRREVAVGAELMRGTVPEHELEGELLAPDVHGPARQRFECGLYLKGEIGRRFDRFEECPVADGTLADVALPDPEVVVGRDHVRSAAPDQGTVFVDDARIDLGRAEVRGRLEYVGDEEAQGRCLEIVRQVEPGVEEFDQGRRHVAAACQTREGRRRARGWREGGPVCEHGAEALLHLARSKIRGRDARERGGRDDRCA